MKLFQAQGNKEGNILQEGWEGVARAEIRDFWKDRLGWGGLYYSKGQEQEVATLSGGLQVIFARVSQEVET